MSWQMIINSKCKLQLKWCKKSLNSCNRVLYKVKRTSTKSYIVWIVTWFNIKLRTTWTVLWTQKLRNIVACLSLRTPVLSTSDSVTMELLRQLVIMVFKLVETENKLTISIKSIDTQAMNRREISRLFRPIAEASSLLSVSPKEIKRWATIAS